MVICYYNLNMDKCAQNVWKNVYGFHMCHYNITSNKGLITVIHQKGYVIYFTLWKPYTTATLYNLHVAILIAHAHIHMPDWIQHFEIRKTC